MIPVALLTTLLFHRHCQQLRRYPPTAAGGKLVLMYRWDAKDALRLIEAERVTAMSGVPVMSRELISHPDFDSHDLSSLVSLGGGGAQLPPELVAKIDASVETARPNTGYGMTETCGIITAVSADFFIDKPDSAGPAMPCYEAKCVDDHGATLPAGEIGESWAAGEMKTSMRQPSRCDGGDHHRRLAAHRRRRGWTRTVLVHRRSQERCEVARRRECLLVRRPASIAIRPLPNALRVRRRRRAAGRGGGAGGDGPRRRGPDRERCARPLRGDHGHTQDPPLHLAGR